MEPGLLPHRVPQESIIYEGTEGSITEEELDSDNMPIKQGTQVRISMSFCDTYSFSKQHNTYEEFEGIQMPPNQFAVPKRFSNVTTIFADLEKVNEEQDNVFESVYAQNLFKRVDNVAANLANVRAQLDWVYD